MKKGQLTLFIIIGLVLLVIIGMIFAVAGKIKLTFKDDADVKAFAEGCFDLAQICMLERMGENGGSFVFDYGLNPIDKARNELEENIAEAAEICQEDFSKFRGLGIGVNKPEADVNFNKQDTTTNINQEITITKGEKKTILDQFLIKTDVRFSETYSLAEKIVKEPEPNIDKTYINAKLLESEEFNVNVYEAEENQIITLTDDLSRIKGITNYKFGFVR